jgi:hypothetical protein
MTIRQLFYLLTVAGVIAKTEAEYKGTVVRLTADLRRQGKLPFEWIADNTRWMRKPDSYSSLGAMLDLTVETYRRAIWSEQDVYVEIWLEKDALSGVLWEVTEPWDVPLLVTRGYPSLPFLQNAAAQIAALGKPAFVYYFGDYDLSGVDISRCVEEGLREWAPNATIAFQRVAVNQEQIATLGLQTRPTKKSDTRSKTFGEESVEVDAIPPAKLREMVEECILQHIDDDIRKRTEQVENAERETLRQLCQRLKGQGKRKRR